MKASLLTHRPAIACAPSGSTCFYTYCNGCNGVRRMISIRVERYQLAGMCESWEPVEPQSTGERRRATADQQQQLAMA
jgi:hypothetical protein